MRKEIEAYEALLPGWRRWLNGVVRLARRGQIFLVRRYRYSLLRAGSPAWHRMQARLSTKSSVEPDMSFRVAFYEQTMRLQGSGRRIYPGVNINYPKNVYLGERIVLNRGVLIDAPAEVRIEREALIGPYVVINSGDHKFSDVSMPIRGQGHNVAPIIIGAEAWLGAHVIVLRGVTIGRGAVIGAGAVVTGSVPDFAIATGIPARITGSRLG